MLSEVNSKTGTVRCAVIGIGTMGKRYADLFDAVIVVTPHKQHPAMAIRALNAGKHVLCDKPAGVTAGDAEAINAAAARSGRIYAMMCHQRTYPQHVKIKELLDEGAIGTVRRVCLENTEIYEFGGFDQAYQTMLQNFADAVLTGAALIAPGQDGSKTLSLVNAAYLSAWLGQKIELPVDMNVYNELLQKKIISEG